MISAARCTSLIIKYQMPIEVIILFLLWIVVVTRAMASRIIKLSAINDYFQDDMKCIQRGENSLSSGHLEMCNFDPGLRIIKGKVKASMKNKSYDVEVLLKFNYEIENCSCSCPRGQFMCHHIACVLLHAHYNISKTDVACMWVPRASEVGEPCQITTGELFDPLEGRTPQTEQIHGFKDSLEKIDSNCGLVWLMKEDPNFELETLVVSIEDLLQSADYRESMDKITYFQCMVAVSEEKILEVAEKTKRQAQSQLWLISRKHRLTSSNFGEVLKAVQRQRYSPSLFKKLSGTYDLERVKQIQWGRQNEINGIHSFEQLTGSEVKRTGLWLHKCGFLGATPDGLIDSDGIIEVKCPYSLRNATLRDNLKKSDIMFFHDGEFILNKEHNYYDQIQGQLHITNRDYCYLVIWTTVDTAVQKIEKDKVWGMNVDILKQFYLNEYVKYISS